MRRAKGEKMVVMLNQRKSFKSVRGGKAKNKSFDQKCVYARSRIVVRHIVRAKLYAGELESTARAGFSAGGKKERCCWVVALPSASQ